MLERETELIKQIIIESTIRSRTAIRLTDVIAANLPRGVKAFVTAEVMKLLEGDFQRSGRLSQITHTVGSTVTSERTVLRSLTMEYVLPQDEYFKLVEDTVHFLENYLCRPQWTLNQLMFEKDATISFADLVKKFECVVDYSYFSALVERHARRKDWSFVEEKQFKSLIAKIDEEIVKQHSPRELALLTKPIFDFLLFGDVTMTRPIPLGALLLFFEDKNMGAAKDYLERICHVRSRTQISMNELIGILEDLFQVETSMKEEAAQSEQELLSLTSSADKEVEQAAQSELPTLDDIPDGEVEMLQPVIGEPVKAPSDESSIAPMPEAETPTPELQENEGASVDQMEPQHTAPSAKAAEQTAQKAHNLAAFAVEREAQRYASFLTFPERPTKEELLADRRTAHAELTNIHEMLTQEEQERFTESIFKNDANALFIFLQSVSNAKTWREAQLFLRDLIELNKLNILSSDVVAFTDALQARYHPELKKAP